MERLSDTALTNIPQSHKSAIIISGQQTHFFKGLMEITGRYKNI